MDSAIYRGTIRHRRFAPHKHAFQYDMFMVYLDLAELDQVFDGTRLWSAHKPALAWLRRSDFLEGSQDLDTAVRQRVNQETGTTPQGPIRVLTNLRYFGYIINPITCYYCFTGDGTALSHIVLEVTNTPWGETAVYVLSCDPDRKNQRISFNKTMHVSPFMPMDITYHWSGNTPEQALRVHLENWRGPDKLFDATLVLERHEISAASLRWSLLQYPFMTLKVFAGIYWQAAKLFFGRKARFYSKPKPQQSGSES